MLPDIDKKPKKPLLIKMAGYLERKDRMKLVGIRRWIKRWCVLEGKLLLYFKTQSEYSHNLSPCRGSVNMGLVLSIKQRDPCQLQIVTRSQVIIFRTKSQSEQNEWLTALQDAKNTNQSIIDPKDVYYKTHIMNMHCLMGNNRILVEPIKSDVRNTVAAYNGNYLQYGMSLDDVIAERGMRNNYNYYNNNNNNYYVRNAKKKSSALRKAESDNRISFYREIHGLVRTGAIAAATSPPVSEKWSCRSRSLSYESIYFKPQEKCAPTIAEPVKSQSFRGLVMPAMAHHSETFTIYANTDSISKRLSRSMSFFRRHCENYDSDDYDYIEEDRVCLSEYTKPVVHVEKPKQKPDLPPPRVSKKNEGTAVTMSTVTSESEDKSTGDAAGADCYYNYGRLKRTNDEEDTHRHYHHFPAVTLTIAHAEKSERKPELPPTRIPKKNEEIGVSLSTIISESEEFPNQEASTDVIYVNNNRKVKMVTSEPDILVLENEIEQIVEGKQDNEPPLLPIKKKRQDIIVPEEERRYRITDGVYVFEKGDAEEVIYDVPIPHGKLIEHIRRLTISSVSPVKHHVNNVVYEDSLEPSLFETLPMTPDSLEVTTFPTYKRWSNDSGYLHEEPNSFSNDQTHFEDSLEPVITTINHDRKIWQNMPNINSTDYFR
ncbi:Pleckstrin homology domain,PH domain-like [Cinara cedri]|uniref:Pleckstrin homology domain,PH domain-like n=1 Tax=Cinara cedri TaxID=506608 RepID=A0A5E4N9N9_9HEMI|nr:Pleckstrin homology domain,PH domain-like [Cinara cedri]